MMVAASSPCPAAAASREHRVGGQRSEVDPLA